MAIKIRHDGQWVEVGVGSSVADGDYGDIIVSNSGATWTLDSSISGDKISEGDSKAEIIDTATESKLTVEIDATEKFSVDIGGPKIHRQDSSNEGGSVVFNRANDDNAAFEIDVYGSLNTDSGRLRILDQSGSSGVERFAIGPNGEIGLSGANYGTSGQVLTSNGSGSAPTWQTVSGGGGGGGGVGIGSTTRIIQGNTKAEVVDTGSDGHFKVTTEGTERLRIGPSGQVGLGGANYGTSGQVLTSNGASAAPTWQDASTGSSTFIALTDTPSSFTADKWIKVNSAGNALEFVDQPSGGGNTGVGTTAQGEPVGTIIAWGGPLSSIPDNYQLCDGGTPQTSTLQDLLGAGANVPDLRDRFIVGAGNNYSVDATGGSADAILVSHSHTVNNHSHSFSANTNNNTHNHGINDSGHTHTMDVYGSDDESGNPAKFGATRVPESEENPFATASTNSSTTSISIQNDSHNHSVSGTTGNSNPGTNSQGESGTNKNLPPYYALCYIIKHTSGFDVGPNSGIGTVVSIENGGSPVGTASTINFGDNLEVGLTGGVATITGVGTFSGDYGDLTNKPTIPTNTSDLSNDSGFIGAGQTFSGDYNDLTNVPQIFGIPSGGILLWHGNTANIPSGFVLCDGNNSTPDLRNRFVVGAGTGSNYTVGDTGGSDSVTLSSNEMPSHDHGSSSVSVSVNSSGLTVSSDSGHTHGSGTLGMDNQGAHAHSQTFYGGGTSGTVPSLRFDGGGTVNFNTSGVGHHVHTISGSTGSGGSHSHSISGSISGSGTLSMSGEGGGQAHENRPPYYALCYIMKT